MDGERLDFARGARVAAADQEIGRLAHVVADPDTRDVLDLVIEREGQEWLVPLAASRDLVQLRRPWASLPTQRFDPAAFDRVAHFAVHRRPVAPRLELRAEEIVPRKVREEVGRVEVGKEVVSDRQVLEVAVVREEIVVERRSVEARLADEPIGEPRVLTIPLRAERVTVQRVAVVREEVEVGRRTVDDTQALVETVRHEEAVIETHGAVATESAEGARG
jgi:uncharacterized protein (TIGR02271 family)